MTSSQSKRAWWLAPILARDDLLVMSEVSTKIGVSVATLRRNLETEGLSAPSKKYTSPSGKYVVYCYTPEDVRELQEFFSQPRIHSTAN